GVSPNGSRPSFAILGEADLGGIEAERYGDLPALLEAIEAGGEAPAEVIVAISPAEQENGGLPAAAQATGRRAPALQQAWAREERLASSRLTLVTKRSVAAAPGDAPNLATAPV